MLSDPKAGLPALVSVLPEMAAGGRHVLALAGAPGSGKSTLAELLRTRLDARDPGCAAVLPMDGYHLDDRILVERGLLARKGAPETFDIGGLRHMLDRLRRNSEPEIAVPVFDRDLEIARAGARLIPRSARYLIVEGNYLLLTAKPWCSLRPLFDTTAMLAVPVDVLRHRLIERWRRLGLSPDAIEAKVDGNDLPNGRLVIEGSAPADVTL